MNFDCNHGKMNRIAFYACPFYLDKYNCNYVFTDHVIHSCFLGKREFLFLIFFFLKQIVLTLLLVTGVARIHFTVDSNLKTVRTC